MPINVAINGMGRIGRLVFKRLYGDKKFQVVALNDLTPFETLRELIQRDSTHGRFPAAVSLEKKIRWRMTPDPRYVSVSLDTLPENYLVLLSPKRNRKETRIPIFREKDPVNLPWRDLGVDVVIEATGVFTRREDLKKYLDAGAKKVVLTAPAKSRDDVDATLVLGVNEDTYNSKTHHLISNASCTTNCLAPVLKVLEENFGIESGRMTTVHSYTNDQRVQDLFHEDPRRARAAGVNIIPTSTGAARAIGIILPALQGKLDGMAFRVPVEDGSVVYLVANVSREITTEELRNVFREAAKNATFQSLAYSEEPLVSRDIVGSPYSSIVDAEYLAAEGKTVQVVSWYDNEWGYSSRVVDLISFISQKR